MLRMLTLATTCLVIAPHLARAGDPEDPMKVITPAADAQITIGKGSVQVKAKFDAASSEAKDECQYGDSPGHCSFRCLVVQPTDRETIRWQGPVVNTPSCVFPAKDQLQFRSGPAHIGLAFARVGSSLDYGWLEPEGNTVIFTANPQGKPATTTPKGKPATAAELDGTYRPSSGSGSANCSMLTGSSADPLELHFKGSQVTGVIPYKSVMFGPVTFKVTPVPWVEDEDLGTPGAVHGRIAEQTIALPKPRFSSKDHDKDDMAAAQRLTAVRIHGYFENRCASPIARNVTRTGWTSGCDLRGNREDYGAEATILLEGLAGDDVVSAFSCDVGYVRVDTSGYRR